MANNEHVLHQCDDPECFVCNGGLAQCDVCNGAEGTLTTDCCGRQLTEAEEHAIHVTATLDFRNGEWVATPNRKGLTTVYALYWAGLDGSSHEEEFEGTLQALQAHASALEALGAHTISAYDAVDNEVLCNG